MFIFAMLNIHKGRLSRAHQLITSWRTACAQLSRKVPYAWAPLCGQIFIDRVSPNMANWSHKTDISSYDYLWLWSLSAPHTDGTFVIPMLITVIVSRTFRWALATIRHNISRNQTSASTKRTRKEKLWFEERAPQDKALHTLFWWTLDIGYHAPSDVGYSEGGRDWSWALH